MKTIIGLFALLFVVILVSVSYLHGKGLSLFPQPNTVTIDGYSFMVDVARTEQQRELGLSGRSSLTSNHGMFFLFDHPDRYSFWMKNMKFPIDIIFINTNKVVSVFQDVPAPANANQTLPIYTPDAPANKVLEVPAGTVRKDNIKPGDTITSTVV